MHDLTPAFQIISFWTGADTASALSRRYGEHEKTAVGQETKDLEEDRREDIDQEDQHPRDQTGDTMHR